MPDDRLLSAKEVAGILQVSESWVRDHIPNEHGKSRRRPTLTCVRIGASIRFRRADVDEFIERCRVVEASMQRRSA